MTAVTGLTTETSAPYNRLGMPVNDQAIVAAIRRQEERLARDPASLAFAQLADLYRKAGRTREAVALCRDGLARYPHYTTARLILAKALAADGQLAAALVELNAILEMSPKDVQCHRLAAEVHRRLGHYRRRRHAPGGGGRARSGRPRVARAAVADAGLRAAPAEASGLGACPERRHVRDDHLRRASASSRDASKTPCRCSPGSSERIPIIERRASGSRARSAPSATEG